MHRPLKLDNFNLHELVGKDVLDLVGSNAWGLLNRAFIVDVDKYVSDLKKDLGCEAVYINDWKWGGRFSESGFRTQSTSTGSKKSQHRLGNAVDLKFVGITLDQAVEYLVKNQDKYPDIRRYENPEVTRSSNKFGGWLHVDGKYSGEEGLYMFNP